MIRVITIAREYGSGGARIGACVAEQLGWRLLDRALIGEIAKAAQVESAIAQKYDERVGSWVDQLMQALYKGALVEGVSSPTGADFFDDETMAAFAAICGLEGRDVHAQRSCMRKGAPPSGSCYWSP